MNSTGRKSEPPKPAEEAAEGKPKKPPRSRRDDDDEDGDIATPKRDRHGTDDEPL